MERKPFLFEATGRMGREEEEEEDVPLSVPFCPFLMIKIAK